MTSPRNLLPVKQRQGVLFLYSEVSVDCYFFLFLLWYEWLSLPICLFERNQESKADHRCEIIVMWSTETGHNSAAVTLNTK